MDTRIETLEAFFRENYVYFKFPDRKEIEAMISNIKKPENKMGKWWINNGLPVQSQLKSLNVHYETPLEGRCRYFQFSDEKYFKAEGQEVPNALRDLLSTRGVVDGLHKALPKALTATFEARSDIFITDDCYLQWHLIGNRLIYIYLHSHNGMICTKYPLD